MEYIIFYFDYGGSADELESFIGEWKNAAEKTRAQQVVTMRGVTPNMIYC